MSQKGDIGEVTYIIRRDSLSADLQGLERIGRPVLANPRLIRRVDYGAALSLLRGIDRT
jgi:hypothetical protein